ncbi:uncharacterized protein N7484_011185 [Penicillium longicatenatum]|uniref:uncharacterized protein n=1 Tax=Penicillium longicatenatum TaxID=1561947 RepID=UPI00254892B5|nr:uncharacterized protein N7484_011185 [Penicillium longicatenatum]KAJ5631085.1 hypothetical protein N7484_011185 [Penicillium longicatenatum]
MDALDRSYTYGTSPLLQDALSTPLKTYLFGKPISHSLSPLVQNTMYQQLPSNWTFHLAETTDPKVFKETICDKFCIGTSITMPNKLSFQPLLDDITEEACIMGSVNTTFVRIDHSGQRKIIGTNTDCIGVRDAILEKYPEAREKAKNKVALVTGAGGAARSAIYALWKWFTPSKIYVVNRLESEAQEMIDWFRRSIPDIVIENVMPGAAVTIEPFFVLGTIPDFEPHSQEEKFVRSTIDRAIKQSQKGVVLDMCYSPSVRTYLYALAERQGWTSVSGVDVVVRVCLAQQTLWLERPPNQHGIDEVLAAVGKIH